MILRLSFSVLQRYPPCLSLTITPSQLSCKLSQLSCKLSQPSRSLVTGTARANQIKKVASESSEVSTTLAAKAKENAKTGGYGLVVIGGLGLIAVVMGTILKARK